MPTYIRLTNLTADGFEEIEESATRTEQMKAMANEMGGEIKDVYLTMGDFDFVTVAEFPNDQMYTQFALRFAERGMADTDTLKALDETEYLNIVQSM
jgi:uncharacterized protein with GYD domain